MWHSSWKTFHVHSAQNRACSPKASCTDCRSQSQLLYPVSAKPSYSLWAIPAFQPWKGSKGSNPSLCWHCLHTGVRALERGWGMSMGCVLPVCQGQLCRTGAFCSSWRDDWYHWLGVDLPYIPIDPWAVGTYHQGLWKVRQVPDQQPSRGADRRRHGAQHQHGQRPLRHQLRVTAHNRRRKMQLVRCFCSEHKTCCWANELWVTGRKKSGSLVCTVIYCEAWRL